MVKADAAHTCSLCINYRKTLRVYKSRQDIDDEKKKKRVSDDSKTNYRYLKCSEKDERLAQSPKKKKLLSQKIIILFYKSHQ